MLSQAILDPGDEIVCGWPSFPSYVIYAAKQGAVPRTVELAEHRYDLDALLDAVTPRTKLVYICHPNNPTGTMNTTDELDRYFERVPEHVLTVVDQAYFEYIDRSRLPGRRRALPEGGPAGRRPAHVLEDLRPRRPARRLRRRAGERLRRDGEGAPPVRHHVTGAGRCAREHRRATPSSRGGARSTPRGSRASRSLLREHGLAPVPSVGNFLYVDTGGDANALFEQLLHEGVIVRPLTGFGSTDRDPRLRRHARRARPPRGRARTGAAAGLIAFAPSAQPPDEDAAHRAQLPPALPRDARLRRRHVDGDDRAHRRRQAIARTRRGG